MLQGVWWCDMSGLPNKLSVRDELCLLKKADSVFSHSYTSRLQSQRERRATLGSQNPSHQAGLGSAAIWEW